MVSHHGHDSSWCHNIGLTIARSTDQNSRVSPFSSFNLLKIISHFNKEHSMYWDNFGNHSGFTVSLCTRRQPPPILFFMPSHALWTVAEEGTLVLSRGRRRIIQTLWCCLEKAFNESASGDPAFIKPPPPSHFIKQPLGLYWKFM